MEITVGMMLIAFTVAFFALLLIFVVMDRLYTIIAVSYTCILVLICVLFNTVGKDEVIVSTGNMQAVNGRYFYMSGKENNNLHFYTLEDDGVTVSDVLALNYTICVSDDKACTYEKQTTKTSLLFLYVTSDEYVLYVPSDSE